MIYEHKKVEFYLILTGNEQLFTVYSCFARGCPGQFMYIFIHCPSTDAQRTVSRSLPPAVQVNRVSGQLLSVISVTASGGSVSVSATR